MTPHEQLTALKAQARESEGLTKHAMSPDGSVKVTCLYQRPTRYGRPEKGAVEALCYRWEAVVLDADGAELRRTCINYEDDVVSLLEGLSYVGLEAKREVRDGGYAEVAAKNEAGQLALAGIFGRTK